MKTILSPRALAQAIGVSESSLKRWADDGRIQVARTAGGHRRIPLPEAIRFIRESGLALAQPELIGLPELAQAQRLAAVDDVAGREALSQRLVQALSDGEEPLARGIILDLFLAGQDIPSICDGPLREAMQRVGELWLHGEAGVFIEHRATDIAIHTLALLRSLVVRDAVQHDLEHHGNGGNGGNGNGGNGRGRRPVAIGGAPSRDPYLLPSMMAAVTLAECGFRDVNLGPETPATALRAAIDHYHPRIVWLSVSVKESVPSQRELALIAEEAAARGGALVIGGRGLDGVPLPRRRDVHRVSSMAELASYARGLMAGGAGRN